MSVSHDDHDHDHDHTPITLDGDPSYYELLEASLRMRPDRILLGELRGKEAFTFLRAVNTGHPGSITTVHADSPDAAVEQITMMTLLAGLGVDWPTIETYVRQVVDVIVQMKRNAEGRFVSQIRFNASPLSREL